MGHTIAGIISKPATLEVFSKENRLYSPILLPQELAFLPLDACIIDYFLPPPLHFIDNFMLLDDKLIAKLTLLSRLSPVVYIETDYFGGIGDQGAMCFAQGSIIFQPTRMKKSIINQALNRLNVQVIAPAIDEFESINLHKYRDIYDILDTEQWINDQI